jgi:hypothetical protein
LLFPLFFHVAQYYSLDVSFFKSGLDSHLLDLLWNKYWVNTLSTSPLIANREFAAGQIADIAEKLEQVRLSGGVGCWTDLDEGSGVPCQNVLQHAVLESHHPDWL